MKVYKLTRRVHGTEQRTIIASVGSLCGAIVCLVREAEALQQDGWEVIRISTADCILSHRFRPGLRLEIREEES